MIAFRILAILAGICLVIVVMLSGIRPVVLPRSEKVKLSQYIFVALRKVFDVFARDQRSYEARDRVMAMYGPLGLILLPGVWAVLVGAGFTGGFWGLWID